MDVQIHRLLQKFPYKTERIRNHLKKCQNFKNNYPEIYASFFEIELRKKNDHEAIEISKKECVESHLDLFTVLFRGQVCLTISYKFYNCIYY